MSSKAWPDDPADLFAVLYDTLGDEPFHSTAAEEWMRDGWVQTEAEIVRNQVLATGVAAPDLIAELLSSDRGIFATLRGLDAALEHASPYAGLLDPEGVYHYATRHAESGRLNTASIQGGLLFGCTFPGRPVSIPRQQEFFGLVRVPEHVWSRVDHGTIPGHLDLQVKGRYSGRPTVTVACVPMLASYDEMIIERTMRFGRTSYRLGPRRERLVERIDPILDNLERVGAAIGVLPEASLSDDLLADWRLALARRRKHGGSLQWLLAGTGPVGGREPPHNRAVLLHSNGEIVLQQDKRADFSLTAKQLRDWNLERLGDGVAMEDIARGSLLTVRESNLGRIAIAVCEDMVRPETQELLRLCGVSHVFVPVFSSPGTWVAHPATTIVADVGAWIVVANSLAVARETGDATARVNTCCWFGPRPERDDWWFDGEPLDASAPEEAVEMEIPASQLTRLSDYLD